MKNSIMKCVLVALISLALAGTCFPLLGDEVYAQGQDNGSESYYALPGDGEGGFVSTDDAMTKDEVNAVIKGQQVKGAANTNAVIEDQIEPAGDDIAKEDNANSEVTQECGLLAAKAGEPAGDIHAMSGDFESKGGTVPQELPFDYTMEDVVVNSSGVATVKARVWLKNTDSDEEVYFYELDVDDYYEAYVYGESNIEVTVDMKDYPVGYHTMYLYIDYYDADYNYTGYCIYYSGVKTGIYSRPSLSLSDIYAGTDFFNISNYNIYGYDSDCGVYLDYVAGNGGWVRGLGPLNYRTTATRGGLPAASVCSAQIYYAKKVTYTPPKPEGATEDPPTITDVIIGPVSGAVSFRTGYAVTPVKSIKAKKVKQWCKKVKYLKLSKKVYYRKGYAGWGYYRKILGKKTKKYWYTKVRVTVNMQYVPGVAGIYIGSKAVYGNANKYTADFILAGKKSGKKISVSVYSFMDPTYGGLSGGYVKKVKVKKK